MVLHSKWFVMPRSSGYERNVNTNRAEVFSRSDVGGRLTSGADLNHYFDRAASFKL